MSEIINKADETKNANELILNNILRSLTLLENSLDRLMRNNFYNSAQYPDKYFDIKSLLIKIRGWTSDYKMFTGTENFACLLSMLLTELSGMIIELFDIISSENGALIIVSAKWERCGEPNVGANLVFALELKTFANNCSRANIRFALTLWPK
jgi:hypothetical protein